MKGLIYRVIANKSDLKPPLIGMLYICLRNFLSKRETYIYRAMLTNAIENYTNWYVNDLLLMLVLRIPMSNQSGTNI